MAEIARRDVFQAIADPTRREIIRLVADKARTLSAIAANFEISQPAISQHIKILNECGLVAVETVGRERYCKIQPSSLIPAFLWLEQYRNLWEEKLDSFDAYVVKLQTKKNRNVKSKRKR